MLSRICPILAATALSALAAMPSSAAAQDADSTPAPVYAATDRAMPVYHPEQRAQWLADCERQFAPKTRQGVTGPLVGAALGGLAGNRIAGRDDRTVGTVAGAVAGGLAGAAIDRSSRDPDAAAYCEAYLDRSLADYQRWFAASVPAPQPAAPVLRQQRCVERTTQTTEEAAPPARRLIPRRPRSAPDKRVRVY